MGQVRQVAMDRSDRWGRWDRWVKWLRVIRCQCRGKAMARVPAKESWVARCFHVCVRAHEPVRIPADC